jgi:hypothetical protein
MAALKTQDIPLITFQVPPALSFAEMGTGKLPHQRKQDRQHHPDRSGEGR